MTDTTDKIINQQVTLAVLASKMDEIIRRMEKFEERFETMEHDLEEKVTARTAEFVRKLEDQEARLRTLEMWRWALMGLGGVGSASGIGAVLKALIGQ